MTEMQTAPSRLGAPLPVRGMQASPGQPLQKLTFPQQLCAKLFAGSVAGVVGVSSCYPIDFAKTKLQKPMPNEPRYAGILDVLRTTRSIGGTGAWYHGLRPNLTGIIPEKGLKLAVFDVARDFLREADGSVTRKSEAAAAVTAAVAQVVVTTPMEIVKIRCQLSGDSMLNVVRELGFRGCYKGYFSTLSRDVTFNLLFFPTQSFLKERWITPDVSEGGKVAYSFAAGISGGVIGAIASTPLDVVKTRLQSGDTGSIPSVARGIVQNEGFSALFLGIGPRCAAIAPLFGIAICIFDLQKRALASFGYDVPM